MQIDLVREPGTLNLEFPHSILSLILLLGYFLWMGWILWQGRQVFRKLTRRSWAVFLTLLVAILPLHRLLVVRSGGGLIIPPGPITVLPLVSALSLTGLALIGAIAYVFGPALGLIAGLVGSIAWARYTTLLVTDGLALATWGYLVGALLHQRYRGDVFRILRRPLVASFLASLSTVLLLSLSRLLAVPPANALLLIDYIVILWRDELPVWLMGGTVVGLVGQLVLWAQPAWRLPALQEKSSFYSRSLSVQFMVFVVPLVLLSVFFSVLAVTSRSVTLAREQAIEQMVRSAAIANDSIVQFHLTGRGLIEAFAQEPLLLSSDPEQQLDTLDMTLRVTPYFQQMLLVRSFEGDFVIAAAVPRASAIAGLTSEEADALRTLAELGIGSRETRITALPITGAASDKGYSIAAPVRSAGASESLSQEWYLIGRALVQGQLDLSAAMAALQGPGAGPAGARTYGYRGFVVDSSGLLVLNAHDGAGASRRLYWETDGEAFGVAAREGETESFTADGMRVLGYIRKVESVALWVVLELPYLEVLATASNTAQSMVLVQITFGLALLVLIPLLATRITQPLHTLAHAADRIAQGDLQGRIAIAGDDEVSQLGEALEQMRVRLQERLNDLSLLLDISGKVSATLSLEKGIGPILEGALVETSGVVARFITLRENGQPAQLFTAGETLGDLAHLDKVLTSAVMRRKEPLVYPDLGRAYQRLQEEMALRSVAAIPVRSQGSTVALFWVGAEHLDAFDDARVNFLTTLVGQAAILIENARLFQTAEGGRQRLAAILASTRDAILVVDGDGHLLLTNPAAQRLFSIEREIVGQSVTTLKLPEQLAQSLAIQTTTARRMRRYQLALPKSLRSSMTGKEDTESLSPVEVPFEDGRTFYASLAPITSDEGLMVGVVVVLRDVTHFKELNEMKSEFVATVSHDLRAPLTFMRGYTTMLSMVGDLNDRQRDYTQRILDGIEQMNGLVGDLLDLRRVEAGVGIRQEPCRLGLIMVEAVEAMRARAMTKGVELRMEPSEGSPMVIGDRTLLRQAISNLVDNALKYTPSGGEVIVGLGVSADTATVRVSDTGIGIAPADQVRLFEKFYRIKRRETGSIQGTGLGLALVKSIVERHNGHVGVESTLNQGSTFYIQLPLPVEDSVKAPHAGAKQDPLAA
jgi:signal transduction histidine kinase